MSPSLSSVHRNFQNLNKIFNLKDSFPLFQSPAACIISLDCSSRPSTTCGPGPGTRPGSAIHPTSSTSRQMGTHRPLSSATPAAPLSQVDAEVMEYTAYSVYTAYTVCSVETCCSSWSLGQFFWQLYFVRFCSEQCLQWTILSRLQDNSVV